ncbi:retinitis pigmentosa 1-like 1 protein [Girardinichthys multiradiatus]|uniref:retinitis pigmentosa 1-like 1 protein n=1 Tax=Girardinichthys multiradiatus TaxID=208333 RepID=UPI001FAD7815|nr:retinitis pigmentosa 1-like 1 protein [Girardinichthys multiradiatus]
MKEICETFSPGESESHVSKRIVNGILKAADTVSDKSDMDAHDFELVPSILPNASPTEVVNEWLKTLPTESDLYDMEELNENSDGVKDNVAAEEANGTEDAEKNESEAENFKVNGMDNVHNDDSQKSTESPNEDKTYTQRECGSEMFNSSIQVMKVLLNSKLDRCNSLPEISPVYGRKLSMSAKGLLDCFVKLRIIDYDPENANEKNERYQELMSILQSLWLSDPPEKEHIQSTTDHHSVEGEYNHTSSSGVDVNSGSTGSGKSSDGVKSSNDVNVDGSHPQNSLTLIDKAHIETDAQSKPEIEEVKQEEDDPATDETIRTIDGPKELPETPSSSNKSSGESSVNDKKVSKRLSQDTDPVWVLTLLNKIEKQFMTHYISAMKELKNQWSLEDTDQLDKMIDELKSEVHKKIQISIDREVRKIRGRGGLPKPPNEAISRGSTKQTEERRRRMKIKQQQSMDSQAEKSDSTTGTSDSDQRGENIDEYCPCETCVEKKLTSRPPLSAEVKRTAPVVKDYDLKKILLMKTTTDWEAPCANDNDTTVETLVEKVIVGAMKEIESNEVYKVRDKPPEFSADEKEKDNVSQDGQATIKETGKDFAIDNEGEISKAGNERPESESGATSTVGDTVETASEEGTDDAITPSGEIGSNAIIELEEKDTDMLGRVSVDEDEQEITETMSSEHRYITAATKELPNHLNEMNDDTDANTEVQSKEESEQEGKDALVKEVSSTKVNANHGEAMKDWLNMKRKLLPSVRKVLQGKKKKQSMMNAKVNDTVMINEMVKDRTEEEESDAEIAVVQKTTVLSENASSEEADYSEADNNEPAVEVNKTQTTDVKFSEEEDEEAEMDEESFLEMTSNATLSDDEKAETSSIATSEHGSKNDMIVEQTLVATLTDQNSDMEETGEGTTSDHDSVEESGGTSDGDETEDEKETTIDELSSIQEEEATEDELSVISETELKKHLITVVGYEDAEETNEAESEVKTSERDVEKGSIADEKNTISPVNSDDSPDENEAATAKFSEGPDEGAEDGMVVRNQPAVTGEHKMVLPPGTDQEYDEKDKEGRQVDPKEEMEAADVLKSSSVKSEDEYEESETAASELKSEKDTAEEKGTGTDEEKLSAISANASGDENRDLSIEDESSEEYNKGGTTENEISTDNGESKNEVAKDETAADGTDIEIIEEAGTVDGEETGTAGESDSTEDINGITNDNETAEDIDAMSSELSNEHAESDTKAEQTGDEATVTATSVQESDKNEVVEEEEVVDWEEQPVKVKNRYDLVLTSEAEDDSEEDEIIADTTENESGKDAVEEAMNRQGSDSGDETNEEKEDKLKEEQSIEATDAEEEDTVKSKSDSAEDNDAFSNDETSAPETEHEINKPYESKEKEPGETIDCEESDGSEETDPGSQIEGSSKALSENESEEEGNSSGIDDERSANNLTASTGETTGQEDTSTVKGDDELRDKDSEAKFEDEIAVETSQEYSDENEPLSKAEHVVLAKELKSSRKVEESIEDFQEEKQSKNVETCDVDKLVEDETPLEESESIENESESESKCEDCSEAASKGHEDNKVTDGSEEENEPQFTEMEDDDSDTPHAGCSESLGDSADGEDEAEEDSEPEEDTNNGQTSFAADKLESLDATKRAAKKTLIPLDTLRKERTESEDGAYADIEDSEHEIHGQKDVTSLESKSLKKV